MKFTESLWQENADIYEKILKHPFILELASGSLSIDRFSFYIYQDSLYLNEFATALAVTGTKAPVSKDKLTFLSFAQNALLVEGLLHENYMDSLPKQDQKGASPSALAYTQYLLATSSLKPYAVSAAALLPCFWIYKRVGDHILAHQAANNPYQNWINTYAGEEFAQSVSQMLALVDGIAAQSTVAERDSMRQAYRKATQYEYMFWDSAYHLEKWPV
ncbi:thiaminase/transcriptional activator TenA [Dyadobacter jejuensis]|uniref:Aminopyrimidine aminohydrolase n=1 Tax=Dyadobacter jejuensis TaxID=1082580 RepID=A0A316A9F8_9BACT|nr:thiaminase II [Dyadobacter jejuensis]PWJ54273.1 thiaminase/transcriptional activator TenA [Dyadobacter jejuensis]